MNVVERGKVFLKQLQELANRSVWDWNFRRDLFWVLQQRCVWHVWRNLSGALASAVSQAAHGLADAAAESVPAGLLSRTATGLPGMVLARLSLAFERPQNHRSC